MIATTRRTMLAALLGAGFAGLSGMPVAALRAAPALPLRLPDTPLRLARTLRRGLGADAAITVRRGWDVRFDRQARGIIVTGAQAYAEVSAPPHLAELARIESGRSDSAMFPIMLAANGEILSEAGTPPESDAITQALRAAEALIARQPVPRNERETYRLYLAQVHDAGATLLDTLPPDLLFPAGIPVEREEVVSLPGGLTGSFAMRYTCTAQADAPWLKLAERHIVTRIEGLERQALESWTLGAA